MDARVMIGAAMAMRRYRTRDRWSRGQLEAYQAEELRRLREFAYARSPFYRRFHDGLSDRPLQELPVLTKATLMERFDDLVTDRAICLAGLRDHVDRYDDGRPFLGRYYLNATSGSTGQPGLFLFDRREWTMVVNSFARAQSWAGLGVSLTNRMRIASVASTAPWHMSAQFASTALSPLG